MLHNVMLKVGVVVTFLVLIVGCANRGTPSGGEKDITPPKIIKEIPENASLNFKSNTVKIYFDEYVVLKDISKQLIISPPMQNEPDITPLGGASKIIKIKFKDTLIPNTTYTLNFGQSIVDFNEENPLSSYRYVFSTGIYIDSLSVEGTVLDALKKAPDPSISVLLYPIDSVFTDSIIYKTKPRYVTNSLDSTKSFKLQNLKSGDYLLVALKDGNSNYTYEPKSDKIGFYDSIISLPTEKSYSLKLFKEPLDFKVLKPRLVAQQKIVFGFHGEPKGASIKLLDPTPSGYESRITLDPKADSLYYWHKPKLELDSLSFEVSNKGYLDTLKLNLRPAIKDSLVFNANPSGVIYYAEDFTLSGNIPFSAINKDNISILDKDSLAVPYTVNLDTLKNTYAFKFQKDEDSKFYIKLLPDAITDFFGQSNDTLSFNLKTKLYADYSNIRVTLKGATFPLIVQLTDSEDEVKYEHYTTQQNTIDFTHIAPGKYYLRVIFDANKNGKYDTGNYLKKIQPERVSHYPKELDARIGWELIETFTLK